MWEGYGMHFLACDSTTSLVCLELGCDPGSPVRQMMDAACGGGRRRLIRVNSRKSDAAVEQTETCQAISVHMSVRNALYEFQRLAPSIALAAFICQDAVHGTGAEVVAPADSTVGHVFRLALSEVGWAFTHVQEQGPLEFEVQNVNRESKVRRVDATDSVPAEFLFTFAKTGYDTVPVTRIFIHHGHFESRNAKLEARSADVHRAVLELNAAFSDPGYQHRLDGARDRVTVQAMIREAQMRVMAKQGWPVEGASPAKQHDLVLQMKGFNVSGMHGLGYLRELVDKSFVLSGSSRLDSLPRRVREPGQESPGRELGRAGLG